MSALPKLTVLDSVAPPAYAKSKGASMQEFRSMLKAFEATPELERQYRRILRFRKIARHVGNYDMTSKCNLYCEGCLYFEGDAQTRLRENEDLAKWEEFFAGQQIKGVRYGNFAGAEPALKQDRLKIAAKFIERGTVFTNGTIRIADEIPYAISISVWGDDRQTEEFRGGGTFWKSIRNFARDPRAHFIYTINGHNIAAARQVAEILDGEGAKFAFNYFSPTASYLQKISQMAQNDNAFFRISSSDYNMLLSPGDLVRAHDTIGEIIDKYPRSCLHTHAFNRWATLDTERHQIDAKTGIAINCNGRNFKFHSTYGVDLKPIEAKCCTPNVECSECRLFAPGLNTVLFQQDKYMASMETFHQWLELCNQWGRLFLLDSDKVWSE